MRIKGSPCIQVRDLGNIDFDNPPKAKSMLKLLAKIYKEIEKG